MGPNFQKMLFTLHAARTKNKEGLFVVYSIKYKLLGVFLNVPEWDAILVHRRVTPTLYSPGWPKTQRSDPGQGSNPDRSIQSPVR